VIIDFACKVQEYIAAMADGRLGSNPESFIKTCRAKLLRIKTGVRKVAWNLATGRVGGKET
jgi:hypothetical protein